MCGFQDFATANDVANKYFEHKYKQAQGPVYYSL